MIGSPSLHTKRERTGSPLLGRGARGKSTAEGRGKINRYCLRSAERMGVPVDATSARR